MPLLCAREIPVPGSLPRVIRVLMHYYADEDHEARHVYLGEARALRARPRGRAVDGRSSSPSASGASRSTRPPSAYALPEDVALLASNESPDPPLPAVVEAVDAGPAAASTAIRTRRTRSCARALSDRYGVPASRIAIGNGSCDILLAAGEALLEPGAELVYAWPSFSVYPHLAAASGAPRDRGPARRRPPHDLDAMAAEITAATRLVIVCNPNNPTSTALPLDEIAAFLEQVPRHVCVILDEAYCEFNTLDDPDASLDLLASAPEPRAAADVQQGPRALRAARRLRAVRQRRVRHRGQPGPPAVLLQRRRPGRGDRGAQALRRGRRARRAHDRRRALEMEDGLQRAGHPARRVAGELLLVRPAGRRGRPRRTSSTGLAERGVLVRAGSALGRAGALRVTYGTPRQNARFLDALRELSG